MPNAPFSRRDIILAASALTAGAALTEPLKAAAIAPRGDSDPSTSWADPAMPGVTHRIVATNGIRLHVAEQGEGPLVMLCHGFPECWYSWRYQLPALAKAGFRAVAPDLRGYGRSDRPEDVEKYTILHNIGDMVGLIDALGATQAVIAGHDIGAPIAWQAALMRPDRFRAVIALGPPFRSRGFGDLGPPTTHMPRSRTALFYQLYFQKPEAEAALGNDPRRMFRSLFYSLSGDGAPPAGGGGLTAGMIPLNGEFLTNPASLPSWIRESDVDVYVDEFARSGFRGAVNWWRNVDRGWELMAPFADTPVTVPALYLAGDRDIIAAIFRQAIAQQSALVPKLRRAVMLPGCGHWTQQERAPEVNVAMIDFLRRLPAAGSA
ncbi:MAG: alpha/beta hydrolase [Sphingomonas sp.]|nr:alpha/beta hydrolase [Sphingomonas sp.]